MGDALFGICVHNSDINNGVSLNFRNTEDMNIPVEDRCLLRGLCAGEVVCL